MQSDAFAAQRREQLVAGDDRLGPVVAEALSNLGADGWADPIVDAAGRIWLENYAAEAPDAAYRAGLMRFRQRVAESLEKTTESSNAERITRWLSTYAVNAGTIQGAYRRGVRFKTWVDMEDAAVRDAHRHAAGQVVPIGGAFTVGGVKMGYPGEPVGPIELWINCRCVAQPAARSGETMSENTLDLGSNAHTRALVADAGAEEPRTGALVVLLPAADDPISAATSEDQAHMTFVWMGDVSDIDDAARAAIGGEVSSYATALDGPIVVPVMRRGQLGDDGADVVFLERSDSLLAARDGLMESSPNLLAAHDAAEQFPEWVPHVTLRYRDVHEDISDDSPADRKVAASVRANRSPRGVSNLDADPFQGEAAHSDRGREAGVGVPGSGGRFSTEGHSAGRGRASSLRNASLRGAEAPATHASVGALAVAREGADANGVRETRPVLAAGQAGLGDLPPLRRGSVEEAPPEVGSPEWEELVDSIKEVTFDRLGLWLGGDYTEYPMGGVVSDTIIADAAAQEPGIPAEEYEADDELEDDEEPITEIPVHGVLAPEGIETGDGRGFREGAISSRPLPYPLRLEVVGTHGGTTSDVVTVGRIDEAWRDDATGMWRFRGAIILSKPQASAAIEGIIDGSGTGVSIDADAMAVDMEGFSDEAVVTAEAAGKNPTTWFSETRVAGLTIVPIPAFHEAYIALGHDFVEDMPEEALAASAAALADCGCGDAIIPPEPSMLKRGGVIAGGAQQVLVGETGPEYIVPNVYKVNQKLLGQLSSFAPGTHDGPGWITHPVPTSRIRRYWTKGEGAAKIAWGAPGDFERCRSQLRKYVQNPDWLAGLCANMHKEALGIWPAQHAASVRAAVLASGALPSPMINLVESESEEAITAAAGFPGGFPAEWFANPKFRQLTPLTIDKESGRIFGHLAQWGVCHIGVSGSCVKPPHSRSNYANFLKGVVDTTAGEQPVGCFTYGIGHADPRLRAAAATAHYDRPDAVVAYVNVGEDSYGIWYSGVLRPGVDEALVDEFRAVGAVSGDWRPIGHFGLDLVASVAVNTPGFPVSIAASGGEVTALIAAGMVTQPDPEPESAPESFADANADFLAAAIAKAMDKRENQKREQALRQRAHTIRQADLRRRAQKKG